MTARINLASETSALGLQLSDDQLASLAAFSERLATAEFNLTSARDRSQIEQRHVIESLSCGRVLAEQGLLQEGARVLDLGAGGGLPGIPIRIAWPGIELTLLESVAKKCRFLEDVTRALELERVRVLEGRAETLAHDDAYREQFDLVVARAVAPLPVLVEYGLPFLRLGGHLAAVKGSSALREIDAAEGALRELGGRLHDAPVFTAPRGLPQTVVIIEKTLPAPQRYPRRTGIPSKRPIV